MKSTIIFSIFILLYNLSQAQSGTNDLLKKIPAPPTDVCIAGNDAQNQYKEKISALINEIESQIRALKKQSKPDEAQAKSQAEQMLKQQGLSQEDIAKVKNKKMTKEERQAMVNQMMQQNTNMSMPEINNMKNMSREGKQAYAEGYATESQAAAQANAKNKKTPEGNTKNNSDIMSQRSTLYQNLTEQQQEVLLKYQQVDQDIKGLKMMSKMNSLRARMKQLVGGGGEGGWNPKDKKEYDAAEAELKQLNKDYCQHMTPLYFNALQIHLANLKSTYDDYQKLDDMTGKIDNTIVTIGTTGKGGNIEYFDWVKNYLSHLKNSYKYNL